ncbi:hypothetical protein CC79DRAFT_1332679 [Sarocladium strictum]
MEAPSNSQSTTSTSRNQAPATMPSSNSPTPQSPSAPSFDAKEIAAIKTDLAALRVAIDMVRAQYEERMAAIREAHQSILAELGDDEKEEEAGELSDEVKRMEMKMEILETQAGGLEMALDRYTEKFMEEVKAAEGGEEKKD